jgi:hypothetical protein
MSALLGLEVGCPAARLWAAAPPLLRCRRVRLAHQPVPNLQLGVRLLQPVVIAERLDVSERPRMHIVDGDVKVPVVSVLVHGGDALVLLEAQRSAEPVLDVLDLLAGRLLAVGEADHQVVALVAAAARVAGLSGEDLSFAAHPGSSVWQFVARAHATFSRWCWVSRMYTLSRV